MKTQFAVMQTQCRVLANLAFLALAVALGFAALGQLAAGLAWQQILSPTQLWVVTITVLPEILQVVLPLALLHALVVLAEGGEWRAMMMIGLRPGRVLMVMLMPLLPFVWLLSPLVHEARPAALADARLRILDDSSMAMRTLMEREIGFSRVGERWHALVPLGSDLLALRATGSDSLAKFTDLTFDWIGSSSPSHGASASAELSLRPWLPGLADLSEKELGSKFLATQSVRWRKSRLNWHGRRSGDLIAAARAQRRWVLPGMCLSLLWCCIAWVWRSVPTPLYVYGLVGPVAVSVSLFLPRFLP